MKKHIFSVSKIILSIVTILLWFIKMFVGVGHLPDQTTGEIVEVIFRHSMIENVGDLAHPILAYIAIAIVLASTVMNAFVLIFPNSKVIKITANVAFGAGIGLFLILLLLASTVARGY
jgi:hypothetical protein